MNHPQHIAMPPEEDQVAVTGNMQQQFNEVWPSRFWDMLMNNETC